MCALFNNIEKPFKIKMNYKDTNILDTFSTQFSNLITSIDPEISRPIIIIAIGTDRSTGDSLGPLIGDMLKSKNIKYENGFDIYGSLENPVHAVNLEETLQEVYSLYQDPIVVGIDACLGKKNTVGSISLSEGPLKPGTGVKKQLPEVGQLHFTGIVNIGGYMEYFVLQNTRLNIVMKMAKTISDIIEEGITKTLSLQKPVLY